MVQNFELILYTVSRKPLPLPSMSEKDMRHTLTGEQSNEKIKISFATTPTIFQIVENKQRSHHNIFLHCILIPSQLVSFPSLSAIARNDLTSSCNFGIVVL